MSHVYAQYWPIRGATVRRDTRLYLHSQKRRYRGGRGIGVVWLCNPSRPNGQRHWAASPLDSTLGVVLKILSEAQAIAKKRGKCGAARSDYLQILNLHYVCGADPDAAYSLYSSRPQCQTIVEQPCATARFVWIAWGDISQSHLVGQAIKLIAPPTEVIYYDLNTKSVRTGLTNLGSPMHPQASKWHPKIHPDYIRLLAEEIALRLP